MSLESLSTYLPWAAIVISIASLIFAIKSYRRAGKYQAFDYSARLELVDEIVELPYKSEGKFTILSTGSGTKDGDFVTLTKVPYSFEYRADLVNKGQKPVTVNSIFLDYGSSANGERRVRLSLEGRFFLRPGDPHRIEKILTSGDIEKARKEFDLDECCFYLRVSYTTADKKEISSLRSLGGFSPGTVNIVANSSGTLS
jgi:hypothetical protein